MDIKSIKSPLQQGELLAHKGNLSIDTTLADSTKELFGKFDANEGKVMLSIPGVGVMSISGFLSSHDIGFGEEGKSGNKGLIGDSGNIGSMGNRGPTGLRGYSGYEGEEGELGKTGEQGYTGADGPTGATGATGRAGVIPMYMQVDQPENLEVGTIWVKLPEVEMLNEEDQ